MKYPPDWDLEYTHLKEGQTLLWETVEPEESITGLIHSMIPKPGKALDIGCGQGTDLFFLIDEGITVIGCDISFPALALAAGRAATRAALLVQCDALMLPFGKSSFDFVNDRGCFHHINPLQRCTYSLEVARVMGPAGTFLLRTFSEDYFRQGGRGYELGGAEIDSLFSPHFSIEALSDYTSYVDSIPVAMRWTLMKRRTGGGQYVM